MRGELVALDLETTGLDIAKDAIIEVGAVRMRDGVIVDEFSTMVDPGVPIPAATTLLTGIRQQDVTGAPPIQRVLPQVVQFVDNAPVIAHNISLDMGFLQDRYEILKASARIDTYDLASVLLPTAPRYNLNSLTQQLNIELSHAHRALDDARAAALLYWALWQRACALPKETLQQIVNAARGMQWDAAAVFEAALSQSTGTGQQTEHANRQHAPAVEAIHAEAVNPQPVTSDEITALIGPGGGLISAETGFTHRAQQVEMAQAVAASLAQGRHLLIEAGTGTGKSLAYLLPAVLWAVRNNQRVVISTNTINLQEQLIQKDIPTLRDALGIDFRASVMKGRSNYLSPRRLAAALRRKPGSVVELRTLAKILVWQLENLSGDKSEISLRGQEEHSVWQALSADDSAAFDDCDDPESAAMPFCRARREAEEAHIVIVNHALLIADARASHRVLPDYEYLIVDEAHQLEEAVTHGLSYRVDESVLLRRLENLGGLQRGLLGLLFDHVRTAATEKDTMKLEAFVSSVGEATRAMQAHSRRLFQDALAVLDDIRSNRVGDFITLQRIETSHRTRASFVHLQSTWQTLAEFFDVVINALKRLIKYASRLEQTGIRGLREYISGLDASMNFLVEAHQQLNAFILQPNDNTVCWMAIGQGDSLPVLHTAPLHVGPLVDHYLWQSKRSVILTSATLRAQDDFRFIKDRLYAEGVEAVDVGSPFNYQDASLLFVPTDIPEPSDRKGYQRTIERCIIELADALNGRVMALFTSYTQLRQTAQAITPRLALGNITVYDQSDGTSRQSLLDGFKTTDRAVLLGTRSFWEGVDIPGESLSALIITRLPFAVPSDPVFAARAETYNDPFMQYNLPDAVLRFRQGFGRLIRSSTDRGIVVILDARVTTRSYGSQFIEALPDCTIAQGTMDDLPQHARDWLS
ncbi:MAG: helicase C-terminal domain-containing protein [Chloroflexota bacterium]